VKKDETYYFGESRGKLMKAMSRQELYARLADAYQLAGNLLIGADVKDTHNGRNVNGWTDTEVDLAIETLLNFLSCPAELTKEKFDRANADYRERDDYEHTCQHDGPEDCDDRTADLLRAPEALTKD